MSENVKLSNVSVDLEANVKDLKAADGLGSIVSIPISDEDVLGDAPDGGLKAWLVVLGSFMVHFVVLGIQYSFGIYGAYFQEQGKGSAAVVNLVGALGAAVMPALGIVSGRLAERFGFSRMIVIGSVILTVGLMLASFCTEIWQLFLTQGIIYGAGSSLSYFPAVSAPSQWFSSKRGLATGLAVSGSGIGGLFFSLVTRKLLDSIGYAWTIRLTAAFAIVTLLIAAALIRTRVEPEPGSKTDWSVLRDRRFALLLGMGFFATFSLLVPLYFIPTFATDRLGMTVAAGAALVSVYNGSSAAGRIFMGVGADKLFGRINSLCICMVTSSLSMLLLWTFAINPAILIIFAIVNGFVAGGFISLFPVVIASIFGFERLPSLMGMLFSSSAIGNFAGAPLGGVIVASGGYTATILYAGGVTAVASIFVLIVRFSEEKRIFRRI
ncbi:hypothetical protein HK101_004769 [Irineochytrium annulatum]|nr:hypothetical protein HK101_004769 [Irineochytrium annulatum]